MKKEDKRKIGKFTIVGAIIFLISMQMGFLTGFGINPISLSPIALDADDVYFKVQVKESLGAHAAEDINVDVYADADGGTLLGSATASSGVASFTGFTVKEGQIVYLQGRQAAPASADGYITPITKFKIGYGDPTDTVTATNVATGEQTLWVDNLHDSAEPHFVFYAPDQANLASGSVDNLTTGDTYFTANLYIDDDECWYGAPDFVDGVTGDEYIGGIWMVMTCADDYAFQQGSARHYITWSVGSTIYHAWNFDIRLWQDSLRTGDVNSATFTFTLANGADFDKGADTFTLDWYDMMLNAGGTGLVNPSSANFVDGGALAPAAVTAYVD